MLSISVIPVGGKDWSVNCALAQSPSREVSQEGGAEPLVKAKSLDPQEGA